MLTENNNLHTCRYMPSMLNACIAHETLDICGVVRCRAKMSNYIAMLLCTLVSSSALHWVCLKHLGMHT